MFKRISLLLLSLLAASQLTACFPLIVAGAATGVAVSQDRRSTSVVWNDKQIESRIGDRVSAKFGSLSHVNITSFNRSVLLSGEVPDEATRTEVEKQARETQDVKQVYNELAIRLPSSLSSRTADAALTTKAKARMMDANRFSPLHVKVVSERGQIFLLGLVKQQEAKDATQLASQTAGVEKVVTLFEYID
ncbi:BON domain-containing protein [Chitinimonas arctica]|uniref:BON domain-containing protein n=1 Tax=Chitinimonas arctica TaxID=2594795 RepID=UPI001CC6D0EA|nr:BON domain-containing protein [Chitinimonas arctica]